MGWREGGTERFTHDQANRKTDKAPSGVGRETSTAMIRSAER